MFHWMWDGFIFTTLRRIFGSVLPLLLKLVDILSFEWLLTAFELPNGGGMIFVRSTCIALVAWSISLYLKFNGDFSMAILHASEFLGWFGAIFAAVYAALYARFASQWSYLANLYNQIKATEVREAGYKKGSPQWERMGEWKAGYIEDADTLHLSIKPSIAPTIRYWIKEDAVKAAFAATPGQGERLEKIKRAVEEVFNREHEKQKWYARRGP